MTSWCSRRPEAEAEATARAGQGRSWKAPARRIASCRCRWSSRPAGPQLGRGALGPARWAIAWLGDSRRWLTSLINAGIMSAVSPEKNEAPASKSCAGPFQHYRRSIPTSARTRLRASASYVLDVDSDGNLTSVPDVSIGPAAAKTRPEAPEVDLSANWLSCAPAYYRPQKPQQR